MEEELEGTDQDHPSKLTRSQRIMIRISVIQTVLAVAALFTGAIALWAALNEADAVRKQLQAGAWPYVSVTSSNSNFEGDEYVVFYARNKGLGPAKIQTAAAYIDDVAYSSWWPFIAELADVDRESGISIAISNSSIYGAVMSPEETVQLLRLDRQARVTDQAGNEVMDYLSLLQKFRSGIATRDVRFEVCYCSVFDDCWLVVSSGSAPEEVDMCPAQPAGVSF